jgi:excisionase family DNA binding protein
MRQGTDRASTGGMPRSVLVDRAAEILNVSRRTVYYRIREGRLRTVRTRCGSQRVLMESIEALLRERALPATDQTADASDTGPFVRFPEP